MNKQTLNDMLITKLDCPELQILEINKEGTETTISGSEFYEKMNDKNLKFKFDIPRDKSFKPIKIGKRYKLSIKNNSNIIFTILDINQIEAIIKTDLSDYIFLSFKDIIETGIQRVKKKKDERYKWYDFKNYITENQVKG